jgi:membrane fusion protein, copper/silver efflux system
MIDPLVETTPDAAQRTSVAGPPRAAVSWWWLLRVAQVRLRFLFVLVAAFLIVGKWNVLRNYWDALTTPAPSKLVSGGVNGETEYFCPMCPGAISDWPTKCSVCNMPLVRRKKGGEQQLPDGVLARMQISPYRVHLAGIRTTPIGYRPLVREVTAHGTVTEAADTDAATSSGQESTCIVTVEIDQREIPFVSIGLLVEVIPDIELAGEPKTGRVLRVLPEVSRRTRRVTIELAVANNERALWPGMRVNAQLRRPMAELEPFSLQPADPPPLGDGEVRTLYTCVDHRDVLSEKRERCPHDDSLLVKRPLTDLERVVWWCPMHPEVTANKPGRVCDECNGMRLVPRIMQYRPSGEVLAVPENAVIDLGDRRVVFVEPMPGMFDAVEVGVGPRCDGYYPVVRGLEPDQRVAATGAFLLDAETRLNPSVAAGYFGASLAAKSEGPAVVHQHGEAKGAEVRDALAKLSSDERASAERQKVCPITGMALGSMGRPVKLLLKGQTVWLCCAGCEVEASEKPTQTLEKVKQAAKK